MQVTCHGNIEGNMFSQTHTYAPRGPAVRGPLVSSSDDDADADNPRKRKKTNLARQAKRAKHHRARPRFVRAVLDEFKTAFPRGARDDTDELNDWLVKKFEQKFRSRPKAHDTIKNVLSSMYYWFAKDYNIDLDAHLGVHQSVFIKKNLARCVLHKKAQGAQPS
jgi:hypothetical protein